MEDFDMYDSFYGTHIFGGRYHDELRPSSLTRVPNLRMNLSNIDPLVHRRSSSSLSERAAKADSSKIVQESYHSLGHSQYRPLQKTLESSHGRETIFSPPPLPTRRYAKIKPDETYKKTRYTSETEKRLKDLKLPGTIDRPTWTNVYYPDLHMTDKIETTHQKNQTNQTFRGRSNVMRSKRDDDMYGPGDTGHQSAEEEDSSGQYRTVLYVVPTAPKSQSPSHLEPLSSELKKTKSSNPSLPKACSENGNRHTEFDSSEIPILPTSTKEGHRSDNSGSSIDGGSFVDDGFSSDQNIPYEPPKSKIIFQGPGRYLETKVYCNTIPTPQSMEVTKKINGLHNSNRNPDIPIQPAQNPLRVIRNDYNQIVVDIKPRHLNEADKQQHVSQWIQVGTLGDTVQSKMDVNETITDENDISNPTDAEDTTDDVDVDGRHDGNKFVNKASNSCTFNVEVIPNRVKSDWFASPSLDTTSKSKGDMRPLSPQTQGTSERTNLLDENKIIKVSQSASKVSTELSSLVNEDKTDSLDTPIQENHHLFFKRTFSPMSDRSTPVDTETPRVIALAYGRTDAPREKESINCQNNKMKPEVAPKPLPEQKFRAMLEKHPEASALSEMQHTLNRTTNRYPNHSSQVDYMSGANYNILASIPIQEKLNDDKSTAVRMPHTPTQKVRNLAAYFTGIINKNKSESEFSSLRRMRVRDSQQKDTANEFDIPTCSSPFFRNETPEERERRLRAVDALRHRTLPLRNVDYAWNGPVNNTKSFFDGACEDYYPYIRPSSVPRPRPKCITTNITRSSTNLN